MKILELIKLDEPSKNSLQDKKLSIMLKQFPIRDLKAKYIQQRQGMLLSGKASQL